MRYLGHPDVALHFMTDPSTWAGDAKELEWLYPPFPPDGADMVIPRIGETVTTDTRTGIVFKVEHDYLGGQMATVHVYIVNDPVGPRRQR